MSTPMEAIHSERDDNAGVVHGGSGRKSGGGRVSSAGEFIRQSVGSVVSLVGDRIAQGTILGTTLNTICGIIGAGVLSLPLGMYNASMIFGMVLTLLSVVATVLGVYLVVKGCDDTDKYSLNEVFAYSLVPEIRRSQFVGRKKYGTVQGEGDGKNEVEEENALIEEYKRMEKKRASRREILNLFVIFIISIYNYGTLVVFARVVKDSMPPVIASFLHGHGVWVEGWFWLLIASVFFFAFTCIRTLEELKWTSIVGFGTILYVVIMIIVRFFTNIFHPIFPKHEYPEEHKLSKEVDWFVVDMALFKCVATLALAYGYHYNVPLLYRELIARSPKRMMLTVGFAFPVITSMYLLTGIFGYLTFGALIASDSAGGDITKNFPSDDAPVNVGRIGLFFHFACVYPIIACSVRRNTHYMVLQIGRLIKKLTKSSPQYIDEEEEGEEVRKTESIEKARLERSPSEDSLSKEDAPLTQDSFIMTQSVWSIVVEALLIVGTSSILAYFITGIGFVIDICGAICGVQIVMVFPGIIGLCTFSTYKRRFIAKDKAKFDDTGGQEAKRKLLYVCVAVVGLGIVILGVGVYALFIPNRGHKHVA